MQTKSEDLWKQHEEENPDEEDEEEEQSKKKKKLIKKKKKKKVVSEEDEEEDEDNNNHHNQGYDDYNIKNSLHPISVLFTFLFKGIAAAMYLLGTTVFEDQIVFISIVILSSFDFWTVKNISGRLLVGLRWWSDYDEEGNEVWRFESPAKNFQPNIVDKSFFWTSQFSITIFWTVFLVLNTISLSFYWGILDFIGFLLSGVNLWGFYKCSKEHQDKLKNMRNDFIKEGLVQMITRK